MKVWKNWIICNIYWIDLRKLGNLVHTISYKYSRKFPVSFYFLFLFCFKHLYLFFFCFFEKKVCLIFQFLWMTMMKMKLWQVDTNLQILLIFYCLCVFLIFCLLCSCLFLFGLFFAVLHNTVVTDWEPTKPHLCSKMSLFKISWQILEVQLQLRPLDSSLPYLRPFQWGAVWPYISKGIKNTTGQSWKCLILHNKSQTFKFDLSYFWCPVK